MDAFNAHREGEFLFLGFAFDALDEGDLQQASVLLQYAASMCTKLDSVRDEVLGRIAYVDSLRDSLARRRAVARAEAESTETK